MSKSPDEAVSPMAKQHELWSLREDVSVECGSGDESLRLRGRWGDVTVIRPSSLVHEALRRMSLGPVSLENVIGTTGGDPKAQREHLHRALDRLNPLIVRSLSQESGDPVLSVVPLAERSRFRPVPLAPGVPVRISVFARLRANGRECNIESPLALHRVVLHQAEAVRLIAPLMSPITPAAYLAAVASADPVARNVLEYLVAAGMAVAGEPSAGGTFTFAEDRDPATVGWSQIDMMFHTRSTLGRHDHDFGATCPIDPLEPPVKPVKPVKPGQPGQPGQPVPLHRPRLEDLRAADPPLTAVIEGRRSNRHPGPEITAEQIGDLLYRTARVRRLAAGTPGDFSGHTDRPYPSGGNAYELELYLSVGDCAGLAPGVYHYDPLGHRLEPVDADRAAAEELLALARMAAGTDAPLPVLITMTARFRRLSWRYEGMAYRLVLMNAGALMQNLYLVSTAMRLAPCAIGTISIDTAARALGTDWRVEPCVAQFMVGSQPAATPGDGRTWSDVNDGWWAGAARELPRWPRELLGIAVLAAHYRRMLDAAVTIMSRDDPAYAGAP
jgi:SagB-type dehydrogenase family enzyme